MARRRKPLLKYFKFSAKLSSVADCRNEFSKLLQKLYCIVWKTCLRLESGPMAVSASAHAAHSRLEYDGGPPDPAIRVRFEFLALLVFLQLLVIA